MDPFQFEYGPAMEYPDSNTSAGMNFQGQQVYSDSHEYELTNELYAPGVYNEYAISQSKYAYSTESGGGMGVAVGLHPSMGLGIMDMDTNTAMGVGMDMNMYTNAVGVMTPTTASPYGELGGKNFNFNSYLRPPNVAMSHKIWSAVPSTDTIVTAGTTSISSTRPIAIPLPKRQFRSAPQFALSPSMYSSPPEQPWASYYYSASPATSASSMSAQSDDFFVYRPFNAVNSSQPTPASPSPSTPGSAPSPANLIDKAPVAGSPLVQRLGRKKLTHSFECQKCGKSFTRGADVKRHESSVHSPQPMDCPVENCVRKGSIGFPRRDHLMEHLRTFHNHDIPKRNGNRKRKACSILED
ncbi:hypothetical protein TMatcc_010855 [Talaromyces marneffei ATCC 18224]|nr:hypothetical protein EYB25_008715 [Talaromyces marneffei]